MCCAGDLGSHVVGSWLRLEREVGVAESSSLCREAFLDSRSIICDTVSIYRGQIYKFLLRTFFCSRTTLVHFLSSSPSYLLLVAASKLSPRFSSSRNVAALLCRLIDVRYAIIDLCLLHWSVSWQKKHAQDPHSSSACRGVRIWLIALAAAQT